MSRSCAALVLCLLLLGPAAPIAAQNAPALLDAVILAQPVGPAGFAGGQALLAVDFPGRVAHAQVRRRMETLAADGGWTNQSLDVRDRPVETNGGYRSVQTEATAMVSGRPLLEGGGFRLQPFVGAFRDLGRFRILLMAPPDAAFAGIRQFESPELRVWLTQAGGPYDYTVEVRSHAGRLPLLPLTQAPAPRVERRVPVEQRSSAGAFAAVVALAAFGGLAVLAAMLLRLRLRSAAPPDAHPHRGTRS